MKTVMKIISNGARDDLFNGRGLQDAEHKQQQTGSRSVGAAPENRNPRKGEEERPGMPRIRTDNITAQSSHHSKHIGCSNFRRKKTRGVGAAEPQLKKGTTNDTNHTNDEKPRMTRIRSRHNRFIIPSILAVGLFENRNAEDLERPSAATKEEERRKERTERWGTKKCACQVTTEAERIKSHRWTQINTDGLRLCLPYLCSICVHLWLN